MWRLILLFTSIHYYIYKIHLFSSFYTTVMHNFHYFIFHIHAVIEILFIYYKQIQKLLHERVTRNKNTIYTQEGMFRIFLNK